MPCSGFTILGSIVGPAAGLVFLLEFGFLEIALSTAFPIWLPTTAPAPVAPTLDGFILGNTLGATVLAT